ncbi:hypothetical protein CASFOL_027215 [Castilleja foliolosa]|uniref:Uncharacterized protein n=1 Tax=Castilleja foliolosa TaxID=1961234 RepID=A0ABD3CF43_9LAMI
MPCNVKGDRKSSDHHEALDQDSTGDVNPTVRNSPSLDFLGDDLTEPRFSVASMDITRVRISNMNNMGETFDLEGSDLSANEEAHRLRRELKQTMNMYTTACKQAISAQQTVNYKTTPKVGLCEAGAEPAGENAGGRRRWSRGGDGEAGLGSA